MNTFVEKHKRLFFFYYAAIRLSAWFLLTLGCGGFILSVTIAKMAAGSAAVARETSSEFILFGFLGLGIAQVIRYLIKPDCPPGFILRHGGKFLYAYVIILFGLLILRNILFLQNFDKVAIPHTTALYLGTSIGSAVLFCAKALILIAAAQLLKRLLPVIEEHKSLV